jgi:hypothetical protein
MKALLERIHLAMASWGRGNTRWPGDLPGAKKRFFRQVESLEKEICTSIFFQEFETKINLWCFINDASSMMYHDVPLFSH